MTVGEGGWRRQTEREAKALLFLSFVFLVFDIFVFCPFWYFVFLVFLYFLAINGGRGGGQGRRGEGNAFIVSSPFGIPSSFPPFHLFLI